VGERVVIVSPVEDEPSSELLDRTQVVIARLSGDPLVSQIGKESQHPTWRQVADELESAPGNDPPHSAHDQLDLGLGVPLVAEVPLEIGHVVSQWSLAVLLVRIANTGPS
jgi:hypothetical protein